MHLYKKELQKMFAPKVKVILQRMTLTDPAYLKNQKTGDNIEQAKLLI